MFYDNIEKEEKTTYNDLLCTYQLNGYILSRISATARKHTFLLIKKLPAVHQQYYARTVFSPKKNSSL